jgi:SNF2 family DNA or RNA helicase
VAPDDIAGGIFADDMGLGKSLAMLFAIVSSFEQANTFATTATDQRKFASRATLIIVSFACKTT